MDRNSETPPKVFHIKRLQIGVNVVVQVIIVVLILTMVNVLAFSHYKRWDLTRNQKYALSDKSRTVAKNLRTPVKAFIYFPAMGQAGSDVLEDINALLKEYSYVSKNKIQYENINAYRDQTRAKDLTIKYKLGGENVLVLVAGDRSKVISSTDMAEYDFRGAMMNQPPRLAAFKGEQAITGALIELTQQSQQKIYTLQGHGEPELGGEDLQILKGYIEHEGVKIDKLNLMNAESVPEDAKAVLVLGPQYDLTERELKILKDYWVKKGRLFVALDPAKKLPGISRWLQELGVTRNDDRIIIIMRTQVPGVFAVGQDPPAKFIPGNPVTKKLEDIDTAFIGGTQSLSIDTAGSAAQGLRVQKVAEVQDKRFWGEVDYQDLEHAFFDPKKDHSSPLIVAVTVEKGATSDPRIKIDSPRMVVVGCAGFVTTKALMQVAQNLDFAINSINWLLGREELMGIAPKVKQQFSLNLTDKQLRQIELLTWGGFIGTIPVVGDALGKVPVLLYLNLVPVPGVIPFAAGLLGFFVWWRRRR